MGYGYYKNRIKSIFNGTDYFFNNLNRIFCRMVLPVLPWQRKLLKNRAKVN